VTTRAEAKARGITDAGPFVITAGEIFSDGAVLELIAGTPETNRPSLLLWKKGAVTVGSQVEYEGRIYEAPQLDPVLYHALRLPGGCDGYGSARILIGDIKEVVTQYFPLPERHAELLARFPVTTWLSDRLPISPVLLITGIDESSAISLLRLLHCLCRHALLIAEMNATGLQRLPMHLSPTLLLSQFEIPRALERNLRASSYRGLHLLGSRGALISPFSAKAIYCGNAAALDILANGAIHIPLPALSSPLDRLNDELLNQISDRIQPRLLMYRLKNMSKVGACQCYFAGFSTSTRQLVSNLAMCLPDEKEMVAETAELLRPQEEELRARRFLDLKYVLVEILSGTLHEGKARKIAVKELTQYANALLTSRGELREYTPEDVGGRLSDLGISRHRSSAGQHVFLNHENSVIIHNWARAYEFSITAGSSTACRECLTNQAMDSVEVT